MSDGIKLIRTDDTSISLSTPEIKLDGAALEATLKAADSIVLGGCAPNLNAEIQELEAGSLATGESRRGGFQSFLTRMAQASEQRREQLAVSKMQQREEEIARLLAKAQREMEQGRLQSALGRLDQVLKMEIVWEAVYLKVICLAMLGELNPALSLASNAANQCSVADLQEQFTLLVREIRTVLEELPIIYGVQAMNGGNFPTAITSFDEYLRSHPRDARVLYYKALCCSYSGDFRQASAAAEQAAAAAVDRSFADRIRQFIKSLPVTQRLTQARGSMSAGRFDEALRILSDRCLADSPIATMCRAICQIRLGQTAQAEDSLRGLEHSKTAGMPEIVAALRRQMRDNNIDRLMKQAIAAMNAGNWPGALQLLREAENQLGEGGSAEPVLQYYLTICYLRTDDLAGARRASNRSRRNNTDKALAKQLDQIDAAIESQERQLPVRDAMTAMNAKDWDRALSRFTDILRLDNRDASAHYHTAICHFQLSMERIQQGDRQGAFRHRSDGKAALDLASKHVGWREKELKAAIANLKQQVG